MCDLTERKGSNVSESRAVAHKQLSIPTYLEVFENPYAKSLAFSDTVKLT